ncbi:hypothetical protein [uncultured Algibacter sp.]|uniref:hypothetical protein n=1 Tax=uncultured Algibacter sp. TaxID=298659 RepID=UPI003217B6D8
MSSLSISATLVSQNTVPGSLPKLQNGIEIYIDGELKNITPIQNPIAWITKEPKMPEIKIINKSLFSISANLTIEYDMQKTYNGQSYNRLFKDTYPKSKSIPFPSNNPNASNIENGKVNIRSSGEWIVHFSNEIRGGKATIEYTSGSGLMEKKELFVFHIRGENPRKADVLNYITQKGYLSEYWFFMKIIRHESGTHKRDEFFQFNNKNNTYSASDQLNGLPNYGGPKGLGLSQLDNPLPTNQEAWNWKINIDGAKKLLDTKKKEISNKFYYEGKNTNNQVTKFGWIHQANEWNKNNPNNLIKQLGDQKEGKVLFGFTSTSMAGVPQEINDYFNKNKTSKAQRSYFDACLIKYYNGGGYYIKLDNSKRPPKWIIKNFWVNPKGIKKYYVTDICLLDD